MSRSDISADYAKLNENYEAQSLISFCGVASGVAVLNSLGLNTTQGNFLNTIKNQLSVAFGGMSLDDLGKYLRTHGANAEVRHANEASLKSFRTTIISNLARESDYLIVNYSRALLGQGEGGHISPLAAYDRLSDRVLVMDTARHKYPYTWVKTDDLFSAMMTTDDTTGLMRGYVVVSSNTVNFATE